MSACSDTSEMFAILCEVFGRHTTKDYSTLCCLDEQCLNINVQDKDDKHMGLVYCQWLLEKINELKKQARKDYPDAEDIIDKLADKFCSCIEQLKTSLKEYQDNECTEILGSIPKFKEIAEKWQEIEDEFESQVLKE